MSPREKRQDLGLMQFVLDQQEQEEDDEEHEEVMEKMKEIWEWLKDVRETQCNFVTNWRKKLN